MASGGIKAVTPKNYSSLLRVSKKTPVLLAFFTEGCGGCQEIRPVVAKFAARWNGRVGYIEGGYPELEEEFRIAFFPAFVLYLKGKPVRQSDAIGSIEDLELFTTI